MTPQSHLLKVIEEMRAARKAAPQGTWFFAGECILANVEKRPVVLGSTEDGALGEADPDYFMRRLMHQSPTIVFVTKAANEIDGILDALETLSALANSLSATDISESPPDFLWFQRWRDDAKSMASNALAQAAKDLGEG